MLNLQAHRGPDGTGMWAVDLPDGRRLALGHRRLAIIDLSDEAAQPMRDASGECAVTYNGEIYNYLELRSELAAHGVRFRTQSDTEVLLEAYRRWGTACVERFNGMFAVALYDARTQRLFCARDRYGEKPFLYSFGKEFFAFASEYKALLQHPGISLDHDEERLVRAAHNPSTGLDGDRQTVFDDIQQLQPGEAMEVDLRTLEHRTWRYWQIDPSVCRSVGDESSVFEEFRELLIDSVRLRLRSDVVVGSCLSGGLDSSAIVAIARQLIGRDTPYHSFTGRFPETPADEWAYASQMVTGANTTSHTVDPTVDGFLDELPDFVWHNELPVGSSSQYAQWCVFRLARRHGVTVLLDGQGSDEVLGGYEQYFVQYLESLREIGDTGRLDREIALIKKRYPLALTPPARALRDRLPFQVRHWTSNRLGIGTNLLYGLKLDVAEKVGRMNTPGRRTGFNALANALEQDSFGRFLTTLLRYGDRNSMAHSREVRLPFCDHRIAEFVLSLPPHLVMGEAQTKRLLRESMRGILPEPIRTRWNKQGFRPPQDVWFRSPRMVEAVREALDTALFAESDFWIPAWWQRALTRLEQGNHHLAWGLWHPFMIEMWRRHFLERLAAQRRRTGPLGCAA
jgi:asparagine synthase (glutamine-hydrolysing)